nr:hypothetical protein [Stenotrophomonas maltophilia]
MPLPASGRHYQAYRSIAGSASDNNNQSIRRNALSSCRRSAASPNDSRTPC